MKWTLVISVYGNGGRFSEERITGNSPMFILPDHWRVDQIMVFPAIMEVHASATLIKKAPPEIEGVSHVSALMHAPAPLPQTVTPLQRGKKSQKKSSKKLL